MDADTRIKPEAVRTEGNLGGLAAAAAVIVVITVGLSWCFFGAFGAGGVGNASASSTSVSGSGTSNPTYAYLTIQLNPNNGYPQYSPANFTVSAGQVDFTIVDYDIPAPWSSCVCNVTGTMGGESINGSAPVSEVNWTNVAHTFTIPSLQENVLVPGLSTVTFSLDLTAGTYTWWCIAPCYANGTNGPPMGVPGYMTGTMTVV